MSAMFKRFERNTRGRDLVVGDVHGCFDKLRLTLRSIGFDPENGDRLFSVGDLVDRGPQSDHVLRWLARPWFHAICGNHEQMAMLFAAGEIDPLTYSINGGDWLVDMPPAQRDEHVAAFMGLPLAIEIETADGLVALVHADCPHVSWDAFKSALEGEAGHAAMEMAIWSRDRIDCGNLAPVEGVRAVVVGHTPLDTPMWYGNVLHIDTGGWMDEGKTQRPLTIIDAASLHSLQSASQQPDWNAVLA